MTKPNRIAEGFRGQQMYPLPRPLLAEASKHLLAGELYPTSLGWFPRARHHYFARPEGADEHILIYCVSGRGTFEVAGRRGTLLPHQALLIPRRSPHVYAADDRTPWSIHWIHFTGEDAACFSTLMSPETPLLPVAAANRRRLELLFGECYETFAAGYTSGRILHVAQVLRHLLSVIFFDNPAFTAGSRQPAAYSFDLLIDFMKEHLEGGLTLSAMARRAGLSVARFSALFKAQTGIPPVEYYTRLRIQAACRLLDTSPLTAKQIATTTGYNDPYYFSRTFRRIMGMPPTSYRSAKKG